MVTDSYVQLSVLHPPCVLSFVCCRMLQIECGAGGRFPCTGEGRGFGCALAWGGWVWFALLWFEGLETPKHRDCVWEGDL